MAWVLTHTIAHTEIHAAIRELAYEAIRSPERNPMKRQNSLVQSIKSNQQAMQLLYDRRKALGMHIDIPWEDHPPVRILLYSPAERPRGKMPYYINLHGGGFIAGDAVTMDSFCQKLADCLGITVLNVNYRLAPDYVFPYQAEEIEHLLAYLQENQDYLQLNPAQCAIGGFSAGGALTLTCVIRAIEQARQPFRCCILGYPCTSARYEDLDRDSPYPTVSFHYYQSMCLYYHHHEAEAACSMLQAPDAILSRFPPTLLFTCGKDSLCMQGRKFAARLVENGVPLYFNEYPQALHGFVEVNRPDYFKEDSRKTPEQEALCREAEAWILAGLESFGVTSKNT